MGLAQTNAGYWTSAERPSRHSSVSTVFKEQMLGVLTRGSHHTHVYTCSDQRQMNRNR
jgi:hypothetical protein